MLPGDGDSHASGWGHHRTTTVLNKTYSFSDKLNKNTQAIKIWEDIIEFVNKNELLLNTAA